MGTISIISSRLLVCTDTLGTHPTYSVCLPLTATVGLVGALRRADLLPCPWICKLRPIVTLDLHKPINEADRTPVQSALLSKVLF